MGKEFIYTVEYGNEESSSFDEIKNELEEMISEEEGHEEGTVSEVYQKVGQFEWLPNHNDLDDERKPYYHLVYKPIEKETSADEKVSTNQN